ncbi:MAG: hypothetical protein HGB08_04975 [Candidatus Moranbacteria bacterium]|nr:hypothetical protein [Candidatus Moranbacteria bacterium]
MNNYTDIFKKAFEITKKKLFLWLFGVLVALGSGLESFDYSKMDLKSYLVIIIPVIIVIILALIFLSVTARAGMIRSLGKITEKKKTSFKSQLKEGRRFFWRLIGLEAIIISSFVIITAILFIPIIFLFSSKNNIGGIFVSLLAFLILLILIVLGAFFRIFGRLYIVLGNISVVSSLERAYSLFMKNRKESLMMLLLFIPTGICVYIITVILWSSVSAFFAVFTWIARNIIGESTDTIASVGTILLSIPAMIFLKAIYEVFSQSVWVIFFYKIASPKDGQGLEEKEEEKDTASAPDAATSGNFS